MSARQDDIATFNNTFVDCLIRNQHNVVDESLFAFCRNHHLRQIFDITKEHILQHVTEQEMRNCLYDVRKLITERVP